MCAEIICISSSESSESSAEWIEPLATSWENYFPKGYVGSSLTKEAARKEKMDPFDAKEPSAKDQFTARGKVLGLPNATFCADHGIKPWSPKIPKECSKGKEKKPIG